VLLALNHRDKVGDNKFRHSFKDHTGGVVFPGATLCQKDQAFLKQDDHALSWVHFFYFVLVAALRIIEELLLGLVDLPFAEVKGQPVGEGLPCYAFPYVLFLEGAHAQ